MTSKSICRFPKALWIILIVVGVLVSLTVIGSLIGVPLVIVGVILASQKDVYWVCNQCHFKEKKHQ